MSFFGQIRYLYCWRRNYALILGIHIPFVSIFLLSCATPPRVVPFIYRGDGEFVTHGYFSGEDQYVLTLGRVDKHSGGPLVYHIGHLPRVDLWLGFRVPVGFSQLRGDMVGNKSIVHVQLLDAETNSVIIDEKGPLNQWTWSKQTDKSFVYRSGRNRDAWSSDPGIKWNTRFRPHRGQEFTLIFEMIERDPEGAELWLEIHGGGFK